MFNLNKNRFVIGEEITLEELEEFAKLDRNSKPHNLTREERLLLKYCYAIQNTTFYINNVKGEELARMENNEIKKAILDTFMYTLNMQATSTVSLKEGLTLTGNSILPSLLGGYDQDVVEFALLQKGIKIKCDTQDFKFASAYRLEYGKTYDLEPCQPISVRELADSVQAKVEAMNEIEAE